MLLFLVMAVNAYAINPLRDEFNVNLKSGFYLISSISYQSYLIGFMLVLYTIYFRISLINGFLRKLEDENCINSKDISKNLHKVARIMDQISDTLEATKISYCINTVMVLNQFIFFYILSHYSLISYYFSFDASVFDLTFSIISLAWCGYYTPFTFWTFRYSNMIKKEGKTFEALIQNLVYKCDDPDVYRKVQLIHLQMFHRGPTVESGGFTIDNKLSFSFMCVCFSYLIIIIQFELKSLNLV